jgi:hypothetical protein
VRSPRSLADRADVDIDRWSNQVGDATQDLVNVSIDAIQFWISYQQAFLLKFVEPEETCRAEFATIVDRTTGSFGESITNSFDAMPRRRRPSTAAPCEILHMPPDCTLLRYPRKYI